MASPHWTSAARWMSTSSCSSRAYSSVTRSAAQQLRIRRASPPASISQRFSAKQARQGGQARRGREIGGERAFQLDGRVRKACSRITSRETYAAQACTRPSTISPNSAMRSDSRRERTRSKYWEHDMRRLAGRGKKTCPQCRPPGRSVGRRPLELFRETTHPCRTPWCWISSVELAAADWYTSGTLWTFAGVLATVGAAIVTCWATFLCSQLQATADVLHARREAI